MKNLWLLMVILSFLPFDVLAGRGSGYHSGSIGNFFGVIIFLGLIFFWFMGLVKDVKEKGLSKGLYENSLLRFIFIYGLMLASGMFLLLLVTNKI